MTNTQKLHAVLTALGIDWVHAERNILDDADVVTLRDGSGRLIKVDDIERLGLDDAVRDTFFCSICNGPMPTSELGKMRTGSGRSACGCTLRESTKVEPEFDTDIRIGDVVELVSRDPRWEASGNNNVGDRGEVTYFGEYGLPPDGCKSNSVSLRGIGWKYGRFRILERDGKPYDRSPGLTRWNEAAERVAKEIEETKAPFFDRFGDPRCLRCGAHSKTQLCPACNARQLGEVYRSFEGGEPTESHKALARAADNLSDQLDAAILDCFNKHTNAVPLPPGVVLHPIRVGPSETQAELRCPWHDHPAHEFDAGSMCTAYQRALQERLASGGAYDISEERESVRRFVDRAPDHDALIFPGDLVEVVEWTKHVPFNHHVYQGVGYRGIAEIVGKSGLGDGKDTVVFFAGMTKSACGKFRVIERRKAPLRVCDCGAEIMGVKTDGKCGDCEASGGWNTVALPAELDPTSEWSAGAHAGFEWP